MLPSLTLISSPGDFRWVAVKGDMSKKQEVSLKDLLEAGVHFGHQAARWNPKMASYLYAVKDGVHVFDLVKTKKSLDEAAAFVRDWTATGKTILFVGTKRQAQAVIRQQAQKAGLPFVCQRWLGGTLTNWEQIQKSIKQLIEMKGAREKGEYKKYTKKERLLLDREIARLEKLFGGLASLEKPPEALFVVDVQKERIAVREAIRKGLELVAMVDSNSDPDGISYPIPANDDAVGSISLIVVAIATAEKEGIEKYGENKPTKY